MDLRPRRATSQIGKSRRNGEAAMRVLRNRPPQGGGSRWIFVCTEIYPRVAPIWLSALPWMEELSMELSFTGLAKKGQNGLSWKNNGESTGQQQLGIRRHSNRGVSPSSRTECSSVFRSREATAPAEGTAPGSAPAHLLKFRQGLPVTSQRQLHHSMAPPPQHPRRHVQGIFLP